MIRFGKAMSGLITHIKDEVGPKALDELMIAFGSGCNDLIPRKLSQLYCVLPNGRASAINEELDVGHEYRSSFGLRIFYSPRFRARVDSHHQVEAAGGC